MSDLTEDQETEGQNTEPQTTTDPAPQETGYITTEDLQDYVKSYPDDTDEFAGYVNAAIAIVNGYIGYNPELHTSTKKMDGTGCNLLNIQDAPIVTVVSLTVDGVPVDSASYVIRDEYIILLGGLIFTPGIANVEVTYSAGFSPVPGDIVQTALRIAGVLHAEADGNIGISSKSFGESGSRVFLNSNLERYLVAIDAYKIKELC